MQHFKSLGLLICSITLIICLVQCSSAPPPRVYSELEKNIITNTVADSCMVEFDSIKKTIEVIVINPQRRKNDGPMWRDISLVALQAMYATEPTNFLQYDSVGVEFRRFRNDSTQSCGDRFHTNDLMLAERTFQSSRSFIAGNGRIAAEDIRQYFDTSIRNEDLLVLDSLLESGPFHGDSTCAYGFSGFQFGNSSSEQKTYLYVHVSVVSDKWFQEYQLVVDINSGLIVGFNEWTEADEIDPEAPVVYPK